MKYLCAGVDQAYIPQIRGKRVLISFIEKTQHALLAERKAGRVPFLMLDNGAFPAWSSGKPPADVHAYTAFVLKHLDGLDVAIALDVIPGEPDRRPTPEEAAEAHRQTVVNLTTMLKAGVPVEKLSAVIHLRMPNWRETLEWYLSQGLTHICLGGTVKQPKAEVLAWITAVFAAHPPVAVGGRIRYHLLGLSNSWSRGLPAFSCDSTTWLQLARRLKTKSSDGIKDNSYICKGMAGWFYHQSRLMGDVVALPERLSEGTSLPALREVACVALTAKFAHGADMTTWMPPRGTPEWDRAVTTLLFEVGHAPEDGPLNPYALASAWMEGLLLEDWQDKYDWKLDTLPAFEDHLLIDSFRPESRYEAEELYWPWDESTDSAYPYAHAQAIAQHAGDTYCDWTAFVKGPEVAKAVACHTALKTFYRLGVHPPGPLHWTARVAAARAAVGAA